MDTSRASLVVHRHAAATRLLLSAIFLLPATLSAQASDDSPYTLHVYTNLVQMPALVLSDSMHPLPPIERDQFMLRVDSGPPFHPTQMHLEGADPITLAIVLDAGGTVDQLLENLNTALASLAPGSLTSSDKIKIFAVDCSVSNTSGTVPADPGLLRQGVEKVLATAGLHGPNGDKPSCLAKLHLWDAIGVAVRSISTLPGRRVVLAITSGLDFSSINPWQTISGYANSFSIAIFGIEGFNRPTSVEAVKFRAAPEGTFRQLCASTGGVIMRSSPAGLPGALKYAVELLRSRYIIEFPRPANSTAGVHQIDITIPTKKSAFVFTSGVFVPLADEKIASDPNTIPSDPTHAPTQGDRKPARH